MKPDAVFLGAAEEAELESPRGRVMREASTGLDDDAFFFLIFTGVFKFILTCSSIYSYGIYKAFSSFLNNYPTIRIDETIIP